MSSLTLSFPAATGYIQGMSDILAPLIMVLSSEHQAFWCFDHVMKTMVGHNYNRCIAVLPSLSIGLFNAREQCFLI